MGALTRLVSVVFIFSAREIIWKINNVIPNLEN
jgi:hypothetical protein